MQNDDIISLMVKTYVNLFSNIRCCGSCMGGCSNELVCFICTGGSIEKLMDLKKTNKEYAKLVDNEIEELNAKEWR